MLDKLTEKDFALSSAFWSKGYEHANSPRLMASFLGFLFAAWWTSR